MPSGDVEGPSTYGEPGVPKTAKIVVRLCEELDLNFADALILAHALADPYSTHLITGDVRLRSDGVEKFEEDMRNSGERERKLLVDDRFSHG